MRDASFEGVRNEFLHSLYGRKLGLDKDGFIVGPIDIRIGAEGWSSAASTIASTAPATLAVGGISVGGSSLTSGSTYGAACQQLPAPIPGVYKTLFNASTGTWAVGTTAAGAYFYSTGSAGSTYQYVQLTGKGCCVQLIGLSTKFWGVLNQPMSSGSTNALFI